MVTPAEAQAALDRWNGTLGGDWNGLGPGPDLARTVIAQAARITQLEEALEPFALFANAGSFDRIPDDHPMTNGSSWAFRQLSARDFKIARTVLETKP